MAGGDEFLRPYGFGGPALIDLGLRGALRRRGGDFYQELLHCRAPLDGGVTCRTQQIMAQASAVRRCCRTDSGGERRSTSADARRLCLGEGTYGRVPMLQLCRKSSEVRKV
ncbi:hypothetical protein GCM10009765_75360 [Fodinicola feengrottensis]|uniref:Uncharacterized protein n=1 Tax=Fodinicola feengrottensis TaxID=435914 RepID=A0ABP4V525_9ACTN